MNEIDHRIYNCSRLNAAGNYLKGIYREKVVIIDDWKVRFGRIDRDKINHLPENKWKNIHLNESWGGDRVDLLWYCRIKLGKAFEKKTVYFDIDIGSEALVFINGLAVKGLTPFHPEIMLTKCASVNEEFDIVLEATSGWSHSRWAHPNGWSGGNHLFKKSELYTIDEKAEELYYIVLNLVENAAFALNATAQASTNFLMTTSALAENNMIIEKAANILRYLYSNYKSHKDLPEIIEKLKSLHLTPARSIRCLGHSHLDVVYLWPIAEAIRKNARTMLTACEHIENDSQFTFACSQAYLYSEMKERYPSIFAKIKKAVSTGRFQPVGNMWVEADINLISGESLVRQILYGSRFFMNEFGIHSSVMWLPDCFGFGHTLPQLMKSSGIKYFLTAKLSYAYPKVFPYPAFEWYGQDGSSVICVLTMSYGGGVNPDTINSWLQNAKKLVASQNGDLSSKPA